MKNIFYVYVYLDPRFKGDYEYDSLKFDYRPFYIGKGKKNRYLEHLKIVENNRKLPYNAKRFHIIKEILSIGLKPIIFKIEENLTELKALNLEEKFIRTIGLDILSNETYDCLTSFSGHKHTEESKQKISEKSRGRVFKDYIIISPDGEIYENVCLRQLCTEHKLNHQNVMKFINKGKIKIRTSHGGNQPIQETLNWEGWEIIRNDIPIKEKSIEFILIDPDNNEYKVNKQKLSDFCKEHNIDTRTISAYRNLGKIKITQKKESKQETLNCEGWELIHLTKKDQSFSRIKPSRRKIRYELISPDGVIERTNSLKKYCIKNNLNYDKTRDYLNTGIIKFEVTKRTKENIKNLLNWEVKDLL